MPTRPPPVAPVPLLLSPPVPLPAAFAGDWAGVAIVFDLDRLLDWPLTAERLLADVQARGTALDTAEPSEDRGPELTRLQHEAAAIACAHLVYGFVGGQVVAPPRDDVPAWAALSRIVLEWIALLGVKEAGAAVMAPFTRAASPSSGSTASS